MGFFSNIKHAFNEGREKAHTENQTRRNQTNLPKEVTPIQWKRGV